MLRLEVHGAEAGDILHRTDVRWLRLRQIIRAHSLKTGAFKLTSGRQSTYLFRLRRTTRLLEGAALISEIIIESMKRQNIASIGGLEMGAVPIVLAVAAISHLKDYPVGAFLCGRRSMARGSE
jgi:orotate phosphoribosyltransferase